MQITFIFNSRTDDLTTIKVNANLADLKTLGCVRRSKIIFVEKLISSSPIATAIPRCKNMINI